MRNWAFFSLSVAMALSHAHAAPAADACKKEWESGLGPLLEVLPSQLPGFRQMQQADGNSVFISKKCDKVFVGEFFARGDLERRPPVLDLIDRAAIDYAKMTAIGNPAPKTSWIFVFANLDLAEFSVEVAKQTKILREGYYVGVVEEERTATCHVEKIENFKKDGGHSECGFSLSDGAKLLGVRIPFAISPEGVRSPVESWAEFFRDPR